MSNGFRASCLFSARSTTYGMVDGVYQSINYGVGLACQPSERLPFTADAYLINVRDRITLTGTLLGPEVTADLHLLTMEA